jgi:uncharacterized membrane protein YhhN
MRLSRLVTARRRLAAYWGCTAVQTVSVAVDAKLLRPASKVMLMPLLLSWARSQQAPPLLTAALLASWAGDVLLEDDRLVLPGIASFAAAHACYIALFLSRSTDRSWREVAGYGLAWLTLVAALVPEDRAQRLPGAVYAVLLTATAVTSRWHGSRSGLGGALFLVSDALIAARMSGRDFPLRGALVMSTYAVGQYLLTSGVVSRRPVAS